MNSFSRQPWRHAQDDLLVRARGRLLAAAAFAATSIAGHAMGQRYWDVNGTGTGSGVTSITPDWVGGTVSSFGAWDGVTSNWNTDSTGGGGGTLEVDAGAGNTAVFSAGTDATGTYMVKIPDNTSVSAGGFSINQGYAIIAGDGNGGVGGGSAPSYVDVGTGTFNVDVATGATLAFGFTGRLTSFKSSGSVVITKTGGGDFINSADNTTAHIGTNFVNGKYDIQAGTFSIFNGGNTMMPTPTTFTADALKFSNNVVVRTLQNNTGPNFGGNAGITVGNGGVTFFFAGRKALDAGFAITNNTIGSTAFTPRMTGGSPGAEVPITIKSNVWNTTQPDTGRSQGGIAFTFPDNSSSTAAPKLYAKWIIKTGEIVPNPASASGTDLGLGEVPSSYQFDAITLDRDTTGTNAVSSTWAGNVLVGGPNIRVGVAGSYTIPANRGIYLGSGGGGMHPASGAFTLTVDSIISGPGQLRVLVETNIGSKVTLKGANTYSGGTWVTAAAGGAAQGALQGDTTSLQGNIQVDGTASVIFDQTFTGTYAGTISGVGNIAKSNTGIAILTGSNTYTGTTTASGGVLIGNTTAALPGYATPGKIIGNSGGAVGGSAGGAGQWSVGNLDTLRNTATLNSGSNFAINVDSANSFNYTSNITQTGIGFVKVGGGTLTLSGANAYGGNTDIRGGRLEVSSGGNLGSTANQIHFSNGARLRLLTNFNPDNGGTRTLVMDAGGGVLDTNGFSIADMQSPIGGPGSFTKAGGGTLVTGQNNAFGALIVQGGAFEFINDGNLSAPGTPITFDGGTMRPRTNFSLSSGHGTLNVTANGGTWDMNNKAVDASGNPVEGPGTFGTTAPGSLTVARVRTGGLSAGGGTLVVAQNGTSAATSVLGTITTPSGTLDLKDNKLIVTTAGSLSSVRTQVATGRGTGTWNGATGILTSMPAAVSGGTTLAVALAGDVGKTSFGGQAVASTDTLVMYTYNGDANLSGNVDADDYFIIDSNYNDNPVSGFNNGDFTYDGVIDGDDYAAIDAGYSASQSGPPFAPSPPAGGVTAVPEPTAGLLLLASAALLPKRRRQHR